MIIEKLMRQAVLDAAPVAVLSRRSFVTMSVGGVVGLALLPWVSAEVAAQQASSVPPGQKPTEQPAAFVSIAKDGTTTVLCNRMDMGQGTQRPVSP